MSASSSPAVQTIAFQLEDALARYQQDFDELAESRMDPPRYRTITSELLEIRLMKASMPHLSSEMADVLIRHVELVLLLWDTAPEHTDAAQLARLRARHRLAVEAMRGKCRAAAPRRV